MSYDFSPLFRSSVGFDRMMNALESAGRLDDPSYPAYDIEKTGEDDYRITLVAPGFDAGDLSIETHENVLTVAASPREREGQRTYLHQGIVRRGFRRTFQLADYVHVNGARLVNGLLHIDLVREVPESMKPRTIAVETGAQKPGRVTHEASAERDAA